MANTHFLKIDASTKAITWELLGTFPFQGANALKMQAASDEPYWPADAGGGYTFFSIDSAVDAPNWG